MARRRSCPGFSGRPQEAEWVYGKLTSISVPGNTKKKKHPEKCLWIVSQFALQKEMQITTALSVLPLGSQNLFWFEAFFNLYNYHKNNTPKSPTVLFQWNFQSFLFCLSWLLIFSFVSCFVLYFPYLPAESRHPINIQCENHVSVCMLCTCCSKK